MKKFYKLSIASFAIILSIFTANAQTASFTFSQNSQCDQATVSFTSTSTGATSWLWKSNGNQFSTLPNPVNNFGVGTFIITLTINGNSNLTATDTIHVYQSPTASFTMLNDTICAGVLSQFTSTSTPGSGIINEYIWSWGDGFGDTVFTGTTTHLYSFSGSFSANLVVYDNHGCHDQTNPTTIYVLPAPNVSFNMSPSSACTAPQSVTFTNTSNPSATTYEWTFGDPASGSNDTAFSTGATHLYNTLGTYTIILTGTTGSCVDTASAILYLQNEAADFTTTDTICLGDTSYFNNTSVPAATSSSWNFNDPGSGVDSVSNLLSPSHVFSTSGLFTVQLTATSNGCTGTITHNVYVRPGPNASFTNSDGTDCKPILNVTFNGSGTNVATWDWLFGDGSTGSGQNVSHPYTAYGSDTVTLIVTDIYGCRDTVVHPNAVQIVAPTLDIIQISDSGCSPKTFTLGANVTLGPGNSMDSVVWDFGDGTTATGTDTITHTFICDTTASNNCIYTIIATLYTSDGCVVTDTAAGLIRVGTHMSLHFDHSKDTVCLGDTIHFWSTEPPHHPPISSYNWSFGGTDSAAVMYTFQYDTGWVWVNLICFCNGCGDSTNYLDSIYIQGPKPIGTANYNCNTNRYTVDFQDASHAADSILWHFGDPPSGANDTSTLSNPSHTYPAVGPYTVYLEAWNYSTGCHYTDTIQVNVADAQAVISTFPNDTACYPLNAFFLGSNSQSASTWEWNFGDPASGVLNTSAYSDTFHLYNNTGDYSVQLIVTDMHGCKDTTYTPMHVIGPAGVFSTVDSIGCIPFNAVFNAGASTDFGGNIVQYDWDFNYPSAGIDSSSLDSMVTWNYTTSGVYTIQLIAIDDHGCRDTSYHSSFIQVLHPYPALPVDTFICSNVSTSFTGTVTDLAVGSPFTYIWDYGDGSPIFTDAGVAAFSDVVSHTYATNNTVYTLKLTVIDSQGCTDSVTRNITVMNPDATIDTTMSVVCGHTLVQFSNPNSTFNSQWQWTVTGPAGYSSSAINQTPNFDFTVPGTYSATLTVTNPGCSVTATLNGIVVAFPTGHFTYVTQPHCPPSPIPFTTQFSYPSPYDSIFYTFGDGHHGTVRPPGTDTTYTYYTAGTYTPSAIIYYHLPDSTVCSSIDSDYTGSPVVVTGGLSVDITPPNTITVFEGLADTLTSSYVDSNNNNPYTYLWTIYGSLNTLPIYNTTGAIYTATDTTDQYIVLTLTDNQGCKAYDTVYLEVKPCNGDILVPNVFTPNGDALNDTYYIGKKGVDCPIYDLRIKIFNRWGNVVYEASIPVGADFAWDGKDKNGKDCSDGTYYYVLNYTMRGKAVKNHGYIELIRDKSTK